MAFPAGRISTAHSPQLLHGSKVPNTKNVRVMPHVRCPASSSPPSGANNEDPKAEDSDLAKKLAAAEAEAEALRRELALRTEVGPSGYNSKGKPKIDGIGYRETIFSGPRTAGKLAKKEGGLRPWGFTEAELLQSEKDLTGSQEYGTDSEGRPVREEEANAITQRRLVIGGGLAALALGLSSIEIPTTLTKPSKPLNVYLVPLFRLQTALDAVGEQAEYLDALGLRAQLKLATGSLSSVKNNLLSAAALFDPPKQAQGSKLAFEVLDYLGQTDYSKYFEGMGVPGTYQQVEYIKFSLQSLEVTRAKLSQFLALAPQEAATEATNQLISGGQL